LDWAEPSFYPVLANWMRRLDERRRPFAIRGRKP
jgi:hypothetical protein